MGSTRRRPVTIATTPATTARDLRRAVRAADPAKTPGLAQLRDAGWQLTQLTGELTDLVTLLAEHTGHHTQRPEQVRQADSAPDTAHLASACRELATLRRALDTAHSAAHDYYTEISQLNPAVPGSLRSSP
ncbi:hypothetical protein QRX50_28980 [Amycolatopsis carbonis]|uniref:Uncharacterized protein n=1 Tax=Amycolatopsis carbonis TaxID=715471 RepID=A0A9Y2IAH3_9PSEU|nr:hypothetical protein [Amycolatopsis sp. 2-15]WIX75540.1 hypothetical protein QRX50_28980 [Amycolatopsis sp. 2-15]